MHAPIKLNLELASLARLLSAFLYQVNWTMSTEHPHGHNHSTGYVKVVETF